MERLCERCGQPILYGGDTSDVSSWDRREEYVNGRFFHRICAVARQDELEAQALTGMASEADIQELADFLARDAEADIACSGTFSGALDADDEYRRLVEIALAHGRDPENEARAWYGGF